MSDLTRDELVEILISRVPGITLAQGEDVVLSILALQQEKNYPAPKMDDPIYLQNVALTDLNVKAFAESKQKIKAIKELRTITNASLKAAKEAIESAYPTEYFSYDLNY